MVSIGVCVGVMSDLSKAVTDSVEVSTLKVLDSMVGVKGESVIKAADASDVEVDGIAGMVQFVGPLSGIVYLTMSDAVARSITSKILGTDSLQQADINDVVGELTNMVTGGVKNQLAALGQEAVLTIPSLVSAKQSKIAVKGASLATKNVFSFPGSKDAVCVRILARAA